jgi:hypothetical protein
VTTGRVPNEWYARKYREAIAKKVAEAPPLTFEAQQLIRRLMGAPAQEPTLTQPVKKVRRTCRQAQTLRAYRRYRAGA